MANMTPAEAQAVVDRATTEIEEAVTVQEGAKILIATLRQVIKDNNINAGPLLAVLDKFDASSNQLGEALIENVPLPPADPPTEPTQSA